MVDEAKQFSWIPFYEQTADKLREWENRQPELIGFLRDQQSRGRPVTSVQDQDADKQVFPLAEIDPFTFLGAFNRGQTNENRMAIASDVKALLGIEAAVPTDFDGIPVLNPQSSWFFSYSKNRKPDDVPALWRVFKAALQPDPLDSPEFFAAFDDAVRVRMVKINLTMGLFWVRPGSFLSLDKNNCNQLGIELPSEGLSAEFYIATVNRFRGQSFPELSYASWQAASLASDKPIPRKNELVDLVDGDSGKVSGEPAQVWLWSPGTDAAHWDDLYQRGEMAIGWNEIGDLSRFSTIDEFGNAIARTYVSSNEATEDGRSCYQFLREVQPGDLVFAKRGGDTIVGYGSVTGEYVYDDTRAAFHHVRSVHWLRRGDWSAPFLLPTQSLTRFDGNSREARALTMLMKEKLNDRIAAVAPAERKPFSMDEAMEGLFLPRSDFSQIVELWRNRKNIILQGAPGVGKSFLGTRLAYALMGFEDPSRVKFVQFHQAYSYEDFVQGYRPSGSGFDLRDGVFLEFCRRAQADLEQKYVFVIDEINRGNMSKILGELMLLIEPDKRSPRWAVKLAYSRDPDDAFHVPPNVFLLGLMNTADRSLSVVDYALRRRFAFKTVGPCFHSKAFASHLLECQVSQAMAARIQNSIGQLNAAIAEDRTNLGPGFCIGHSYFCSPPQGLQSGAIGEEEWYRNVIEYEVVPLLEEYWFDAPERADEWKRRLLASG